ncbi:hypothetical protein [Agromyces humi]|uniref:hypothetical protein n=1 Tax=Agromyces humi TaxID=1766800 RepID=UPI001358C69D|nr:hypothetical protein [Agromyces humi]
MHLTVRRTGAIAALAAAALGLTGCVSVKLPGENIETATATPALLDLSFEAGANLQADAHPELVDTIDGQDGWLLNGTATGARVYKDTSGGCVVTVHNGSVPASVTVDGDDRANTDRYLAHLYSAPEPRIAESAADAGIPYAGGSAAFRQVAGADPDGTRWATIARVFAKINVAVFADIDCAAGADADGAVAYVTTHVHVAG